MTLHRSVTSLAALRPAIGPDRLTEPDIRVQLAAAYRIFEHFGWTQLIYGHITARVPGPASGAGGQFLINPFGLAYDEVTASNLVKIDIDGNIVEGGAHPVNPAGWVIHSAIHGARHDVQCVMHTHTTAGMAVAAMEDGLCCHDFAGIALHDRIAYHDFEGVTVRADERRRLVDDLGDRNLMILRNHGLLSCGRTIPEAFMRLYMLETACRVQVAAQATGQALLTPPPALCEDHAAALEDADGGQLAYAALMRKMDRIDPTYRS